MEQVKHIRLQDGVYLTTVHTAKFKSSRFGVKFLMPLDPEHASEYALLPWVLRRGSQAHPDMACLSAALDELYGGVIEPDVTKKGETQCIGFAASFLDDAYALEGEALLEPACRLLGELVLKPLVCEGVFSADYVAGERENLVDRIRATINDKRQYSMLRLGQEMCRDEAYGVSRYGDEERACAITPDSLWGAYRTLLERAWVEIYYCGSAEPERVEQAVRAAFAALPDTGCRISPACQVRANAGREPRVIEQAMDVTQGKLAMGFRTGGVTAGSEDYPALMVFNAVFGGTSMSKLFMNVREKLSLCYFASSMLEKHKGLMMVSSGIEFDKYDRARTEILAQLEACRRGDITQEELEGAKRILITALRTTLDSQNRLADFWLGQRIAGLDQSPARLVELLERVDMDRVVAAARSVELDTVYFLKGKEEQA
ncbi:MAG: insulinase family protein [Oscillospiraceae bacterium]|nr:insulinase family protein [Oscillospiraceae bacterium]